MSTPASSIPIGSWVLVTGATGFIASHVIRQFLHRGYKVRGTVRDLAQASWLVDEHFKSYSDNHNFELVVVPDLSTPGAFDEAVKGMSAVAHVAAITSFDPDPNKIIPPSIAGIQAIMPAAAKDPSVKEVVFTSSIMAVKLPTLSDETIRVGRDTWNDYVMELASAPPPYDDSNSMNAYAAGKVAAEKEVWRWVEENKPKFNINVICPFGVAGEPLHKKHVNTPANWVATIFKGGKEQLDAFPASFFTDVGDVATLHVAAVLDPAVNNARLHVWGHRTHWNDFLTTIRRLRPQREFIEDWPKPQYLTMYTDQFESVELLRKWGGQNGWKALETSITESVENEYFTL
ncbi:Epimerase domain-containing protein [Fusarium acuminatum]|uniref:Epimerase domain-containing protein n=1 Tax=Fusarium acuminatum TaxID=5515 RepID=A0ABZ2XDI0_9HYPO